MYYSDSTIYNLIVKCDLMNNSLLVNMIINTKVEKMRIVSIIFIFTYEIIKDCQTEKKKKKS